MLTVTELTTRCLVILCVLLQTVRMHVVRGGPDTLRLIMLIMMWHLIIISRKTARSSWALYLTLLQLWWLKQKAPPISRAIYTALQLVTALWIVQRIVLDTSWGTSNHAIAEMVMRFLLGTIHLNFSLSWWGTIVIVVVVIKLLKLNGSGWLVCMIIIMWRLILMNYLRLLKLLMLLLLRIGQIVCLLLLNLILIHALM